MLDVSRELGRWFKEGREFAVATVVGVAGSAPRGLGAALAVDSGGTALGSVSGGCVEAAVYDLCQQALADGKSVVERFGHSDEDAFAVGLTCGGTIDILITPVTATTSARAVIEAAVNAMDRGEPTALARIIRGPADLLGASLLVRADGSYEGSYAGCRPGLEQAAAAHAHALLEAGRTGTVEVSENGSLCPGGLTLLVEAHVPPPRMIVFGAIDFAAALVRVGKFLGYHVTVCDARPAFATRARFPEADTVVVDWPHRYLEGTETDERTALCVLTHDPKFDIPLLEQALRMPVAYIGAMGSRRTHSDRTRRLREAGLGAEALARLRSPIGLDLGARTPEETALSIAAEIVATRHRATGVPLAHTSVSIHRAPAQPALGAA
ncbi:XdhC/CoxI family protein [Streptomyces sp. NPDC006332]|uniref:XdhC family protein n=1 Tax=Streptomyces sp. NPDC006332 TaxID=3155456 RepID=UPI0033B0426D